MNPIEESIWNYIDGICSAEEHETMTKLIAENPDYAAKYQELLALNEQFNLVDIDEPSMSFTNKVMDKLALQTKPLSAKALIDNRIIYAIAAFFVCSITLVVLYSLTQVNWSSSTENPINFKVDLSQYEDKLRLPAAVRSTLINGFIMFDIIAGLMIFDKILRKR